MFIPVRHENRESRRWPVISIALVLINFGVFLFTNPKTADENPKTYRMTNPPSVPCCGAPRTEPA
jgi:hypothetical protein